MDAPRVLLAAISANTTAIMGWFNTKVASLGTAASLTTSSAAHDVLHSSSLATLPVTSPQLSVVSGSYIYLR